MAREAAPTAQRSAPRNRAIWAGALSVGLVHVPVRLVRAVASKQVHFHDLHDEDGAPIRHRSVCSLDGKTVSHEHIVKGFDLGRGRYVRVRADELRAFDPRGSRTIEIEDFVAPREIDPIFYDRTYYLVPKEGAARPYALLREALRACDRTALGRVVLRARQHLCAVRPMGHALLLSTLDYADEIIPESELEGLPGPETTLNDREIALAERLVELRSARFRPEKYHDEYREKVLAFLRRKAEGEVALPPAPAEPPAPPSDLEGALEETIAESERRRSAA